MNSPNLILPQLAATATHLLHSLLLAQATGIESQIDAALHIIQLITLPMAVALLAYAAYCISEGRLREGILAIIGALVLALAVPIARLLFNL